MREGPPSRFAKACAIFAVESAIGCAIGFAAPLLFRVGISATFLSGKGGEGSFVPYVILLYIFTSLPILLYLPTLAVGIVAIVTQRYGLIVGLVGACILTIPLDSYNAETAEAKFDKVRRTDLAPTQRHDLVVFDGEHNFSSRQCLDFLKSTPSHIIATRFHDYKWQMNEWKMYRFSQDGNCVQPARKVEQYIPGDDIHFDVCETKSDQVDINDAILYTEQWSSRAADDVDFIPLGFNGRYETIAEVKDSQKRLLRIQLSGSIHKFYSSLLRSYQTGADDRQIFVNSGKGFGPEQACEAAASQRESPH